MTNRFLPPFWFALTCGLVLANPAAPQSDDVQSLAVELLQLTFRCPVQYSKSIFDRHRLLNDDDLYTVSTYNANYRLVDAVLLESSYTQSFKFEDLKQGKITSHSDLGYWGVEFRCAKGNCVSAHYICSPEENHEYCGKTKKVNNVTISACDKESAASVVKAFSILGK